jgi:hypothetical protein
MWCGRVGGSARDVPSKTGYRLDSEIVDDFVVGKSTRAQQVSTNFNKPAASLFLASI